MKRIILFINVFIILLLPNVVMAKKLTCNNGEYSISLEVEKDTINIYESQTIKYDSDKSYKVDYTIEDASVISVSNEGVIRGLKEGNTTVYILVSFYNGETLEATCKANLSIAVVSNDSSLKSLTVDEYELKPEFNSAKLEYEITIPYSIEKINIDAVPNNDNAKVTGIGRKYITDGENKFDVSVIASDGTETVYKLVVNREEPSDDSTLKFLSVDGFVLTPKFDPKTYKYSFHIDKDVESIVIRAEGNNPNSIVQGTGTFYVPSGESSRVIKVIAENKTETKYEIIINKNLGSSSLGSLKVNNAELTEPFSPDKYVYYTTVGSEINKLDIDAKSLDNDQIEIMGNELLKTGENDIILRVTGKDKSTTTYKIVVTKLAKEEEEKIEKNNKLLKILFIVFIVTIVLMACAIGLFLKRNIKRKRKKNVKLK